MRILLESLNVAIEVIRLYTVGTLVWLLRPVLHNVNDWVSGVTQDGANTSALQDIEETGNKDDVSIPDPEDTSCTQSRAHELVVSFMLTKYVGIK